MTDMEPCNGLSRFSSTVTKNQDSDCDYSYSDQFDSDSNSDITNVTHRSSSSSSSSKLERLEPSVGTLRLNLPEDCSTSKHFSSMSSTTSSERIRGRSSKDLELFPRYTRKNMSFTNMQVMKIERDNQCLLNKIMANHKPISDNKNLGYVNRVSSSGINRRKFQRKIEEENMIMLRKIQSAKPRVLTGARKY